MGEDGERGKKMNKRNRQLVENFCFIRAKKIGPNQFIHVTAIIY